ncbi:hypothetical protein DAEQUDRAFT_562379 [Daedalea quercina L-15889]|uniref:Uncharacterized protein n=1 Tax=Daedalea quercina L-15889 TaxID=1314783 RepID=A0A165LYZ0_9APHY|nr:hypothetical protein DAEQUDRAFT_562379 [Daedalea quercina L-15889]
MTGMSPFTRPSSAACFSASLSCSSTMRESLSVASRCAARRRAFSSATSALSFSTCSPLVSRGPSSMAINVLEPGAVSMVTSAPGVAGSVGDDARPPPITCRGVTALAMSRHNTSLPLSRRDVLGWVCEAVSPIASSSSSSTNMSCVLERISPWREVVGEGGSSRMVSVRRAGRGLETGVGGAMPGARLRSGDQWRRMQTAKLACVARRADVQGCAHVRGCHPPVEVFGLEHRRACIGPADGSRGDAGPCGRRRRYVRLQTARWCRGQQCPGRVGGSGSGQERRQCGVKDALLLLLRAMFSLKGPELAE